MTIQTIIDKIANGNVAIVLVDSFRLNNLNNSKEDTNNYSGHYILIVGLLNKHTASTSHDNTTTNNENCIFLYLDPAKTSQVIRISANQLNIARLHSGTDEDIIFIN